jgi:hypothetical protein
MHQSLKASEGGVTTSELQLKVLLICRVPGRVAEPESAMQIEPTFPEAESREPTTHFRLYLCARFRQKRFPGADAYGEVTGQTFLRPVSSKSRSCDES